MKYRNSVPYEFVYEETGEYFYEFLETPNGFGLGDYCPDISIHELFDLIINVFTYKFPSQPKKMVIRAESKTNTSFVYDGNASEFYNVKDTSGRNIPFFLIVDDIFRRACRPNETIVGYFKLVSVGELNIRIEFTGRRYFND